MASDIVVLQIKKRLLAHLKNRKQILEEMSLNIAPHFVPTNVEILRTALQGRLKPGVDFDKLYTDIMTDIGNRYKRTIYTTGQGAFLVDMGGKTDYILTASELIKYTPALVKQSGDKGDIILGVIFATKADSFNSAYESLFAGILRKYTDKLIDRHDTEISPGFDVGHTLVSKIEGEDFKIGTSPSYEQYENVSGEIDKVVSDLEGNVKKGQKGYKATQERIKKLKKLQDALKGHFAKLNVHKDYTDVINLNLTKEFGKDFLQIGGNLVIIQERQENQLDFAKLEQKLLDDIKIIVGNAEFSRSLKQEIHHRIASAIQGIEVAPSKAKKTIEASSTYSDKSKITSGTNSSKTPIAKTRTSQLRTAKGQFSSELSIQNILNLHLHDMVGRNMGDGNRRDILNYRTGRFANSVEVKSISRSREDAMTIFYTYMRNPYATFEPGGKQGLPISRDPKLLIAKSIRDLLTPLIRQKFRSVAV